MKRSTQMRRLEQMRRSEQKKDVEQIIAGVMRGQYRALKKVHEDDYDLLRMAILASAIMHNDIRFIQSDWFQMLFDIEPTYLLSLMKSQRRHRIHWK